MNFFMFHHPNIRHQDRASSFDQSFSSRPACLSVPFQGGAIYMLKVTMTSASNPTTAQLDAYYGCQVPHHTPSATVGAGPSVARGAGWDVLVRRASRRTTVGRHGHVARELFSIRRVVDVSLQITNSVFERNVAGTGGAIYGKQVTKTSDRTPSAQLGRVRHVFLMVCITFHLSTVREQHSVKCARPRSDSQNQTIVRAHLSRKLRWRAPFV
jgi:predicted outer membrane repeat protein